MDQDSTPGVDTSLAAHAFGELRGEISLLRRAVERLTDKSDMHDQIRAKLYKAIGVELANAAEGMDAASPERTVAVERSLAPLRRAQQLHDRIGVKDRLKRLEKLIPVQTEQAGPGQSSQAG